MTTRRLCSALVLIGLFAMAVHWTIDPDLWWHLRTGELILAKGIPQQDPFSFTMAGKEWITHEWLSEVVMWSLYQAGGLTGLMVSFGLLIALSFWLVFRSCVGRPFLAAFVVLLSASSSSLVFGARPQIFNLLMTALFVHLLHRFRSGLLTRRGLWVFPLLTAVWANLHSGFLVGIVLLGTHVVGDTLHRWIQPGDPRALPPGANRDLALATAGSFLAAAINPSGVALWTYPFFTLGSPAMQTIIQEWHSPDFHRSTFWPYGAMMALGVVSWAASRTRPTVTEVLLFLGTGAAGLISVRHIPLFAVVSAPIVALYLLDSIPNPRLHGVLSGTVPPPPATRGSGLLNWATLVAVTLGAGSWVAGRIAGNSESIAEAYPVAAVDFLEREGLTQARGLNSYNWGGYLIWRRVPVFVDGRADVYGDDFLFEYDRIIRIGEGWDMALADHGVDYVLVEQGARLATVLSVTGRWQEVYRDDVATVMVRMDRAHP